MDFTNLHEQPCVLAKQMEFRWFHGKLSGEEGVCFEKFRRRLCHNMPFLRRTLAYSRPPASSKKSRGRSAATKANRRHRKFDLLRGLFGHQSPSAMRHVSPLHHNDELPRSSKAASDRKGKMPAGYKKGDGIALATSVNYSSKQSEKSVRSVVFGKENRATICGDKKSKTNTSAMLPPRKVFFHFFYVQHDGVPAVYVEMREDTRCPFCFFDPCTHHGLMIHCSTVHNERLSFTQRMKDDKGNIHLAVQSKPFWPSPEYQCEKQEHLVDFVFIRQSTQPEFPDVPFAKIPSHKIARLDLAERKKRVRLLEMQAADSETVSGYSHGDAFPVRQYYHSRTKLPMLDSDWEEDSDEEPDDSWLHRMGEVLMDDFDDVKGTEKVFMKLWNRFIKTHTILADKNVPLKCMEFISTHGQKLVQLKLRQNLMLHLFNLWDSRLVSSSHILSCLSAYDSFKESVGAPERSSSTIPHSPGSPRKRGKLLAASDASPPTKKRILI